ncbi:hypothetical protein D9756_007686 [Leucocoprinus leucothites]|uniref:Uncharacterized protein n=1 Tax=Leucocoprinus leucothites TaxID=201217 RepID=A0A8H5FWM3_9AGAR|nr:hypothetical protein D9756_007686 [Leucoagaricus leucothites]
MPFKLDGLPKHKYPSYTLHTINMIIKPKLNGFDPPIRNDIPLASTPAFDPDDGQVNGLPSEEPPPPYTAIEFGEAVPETQEQLATNTQSLNQQFCRCVFTGTKNRSWSINDTLRLVTVPRSPGLDDIRDGGRRVINSTLLLAETSLIVAGGITEGFGKIMTGLGKTISHHRILLTRKDN